MDLALGLAQDDEELKDSPELKLTAQREDLLAEWSKDPWTFLTAKDPETKQPIIRTVDQRDKKQPIKAFPAHLDYLHYLLDLLNNEEFLAGEKSSQIMFSTTVLLFDAWKCAFSDGWKVLLSKHSEEEAEKLLAEKIREPFRLMPEWVRFHLRASQKPQHIVTFPKPAGRVESIIVGVPENAAVGKARGQTYQAGRIDEAEFQDMLRDLITAMLPRCGQLVMWSTPAQATESRGAEIFRSFLADDPVTLKGHPSTWAIKKKWVHVKGMDVRRNNDKDLTIVRLHYSADPSKTKAWAESAAKKYTSKQDWDREMEISRVSSVGKPFHPQFQEYPRRYVLKCQAMPKSSAIIRAWDFGGNRPACIWATWDARQKRLWVLRELLGLEIDTYQFRDLVRYVSGQAPVDVLEPHQRALSMLKELEFEKAYPPAPWFTGPNKFLDFAGHEGRMGPRGLVRAGEAQTADQILELGGIHLYSRFTLHSTRTELINGLSRVAEDGWPRLLIDPSCKLLWEGLTFGIVYDKPTAKQPNPDEPARHPTYTHLYDALGYAVANIVSIEDADYFKASFGPDGQILLPGPTDGQMMSYLCGSRG